MHSYTKTFEFIISVKVNVAKTFTYIECMVNENKLSLLRILYWKERR